MNKPNYKESMPAPMAALVFLAMANTLPAAAQAQEFVEAPEAPRLTQLQAETLYRLEFRTVKKQLSLNPWKHAKNALKAQTRWVDVGASSYHNYRVGDEVSGRNDVVGFLDKGDFSRYVVEISDKDQAIIHFARYSDGTTEQLGHKEAQEIMGKLKAEQPEHLLETSFGGTYTTYVLEQPWDDYEIDSIVPLERCFVTARVKNQTLSFSIQKHVRNALTDHKIDFEIPCEDAGNETLWDSDINTGSLLLSGRITSVNADILREWEKTDPNNSVVTTAAGTQFIVPNQQLESQE